MTRQDLDSAVEKLAEAFEGQASVCALQLDGAERCRFMSTLPLPGASTLKIFVLLHLFERAEAGSVQLEERIHLRAGDHALGSGVLAHLGDGLQPSIHDLAVLMMMVSDNTAANLLIDRLGLASINNCAARFGATGTELRRRIDRTALGPNPAALGVTTAEDLATVLHQLATGRLLSAAATAEVLRIMRIQKYIEPLRRHLPANPYANEFGEPEPVWVASKTGSLTGVRCEAGIVATPHSRWTIAVMTANAHDRRVSSDHRGVQLITEVSRKVFESWSQPTEESRQQSVPAPGLQQ